MQSFVYGERAIPYGVENPSKATFINQNNDFNYFTIALYTREFNFVRYSLIQEYYLRLDKAYSDEIFPYVRLTEIKRKDFFLVGVSFSQFISDLHIHILSSRAHPPTV